MDRVIVNRNGIISKCNEFPVFYFKDLMNDSSKQKELMDWLNSNLKTVQFVDYLENTDSNEYRVEVTLKQILKEKYPHDFIDVEVTKKFIIIKILVNDVSDGVDINGVEEYLGLTGYDKEYDEGDYNFDHMEYAYYRRPPK